MTEIISYYLANSLVPHGAGPPTKVNPITAGSQLAKTTSLIMLPFSGATSSTMQKQISFCIN